LTVKAAVIGAGVVGAGWVARFALHGWEVSVYDPMPGFQARVEAVLDRARLCLAALYDCPLPEEGAIGFAAEIGEAVEGAGWVWRRTFPAPIDSSFAIRFSPCTCCPPSK
jgi:carnitine 3-dehydrogenase